MAEERPKGQFGKGSYKARGLTDRDRQVLDTYYTNGFNLTQAMLDGGYAKTTASNRHNLFKDKPAVQAEMARREAVANTRFEVDQAWVVKQLTERAKSGEILARFKKVEADGSLRWNFKDATEEDLKLITGLGVEFIKSGRGPDAVDITKFKVTEPDVHAALMALGRHFGMFNDKLEVTEGGSVSDRIKAGRERAYAKADAADGKGPRETTVH